MCGIAGAVGLSPDARPELRAVRRMSQLIAHRGPDGDGLWTSPSGRACLAHRRLSVIDLATGAQPMVAGDGTSGIVFNGEIYNYRELRDVLRRDGATLRTESDTEVLLQMLRRDGLGCLDLLRGMFAFAYWDDCTGRLLLARDRLGKKPLYFAIHDGCLYFASSLRAVRAVVPTSAVSMAALDSYLTLGYIPAPLTIFPGISKLRAGHAVEADAAGLREARYWNPAPSVDRFSGSMEAATDALEELLSTAVRLRLRSDVPLGVFLSGGIDSSLMAAMAAREQGGSVRTFSIAMDDVAFDESPYAAAVAARLGTEHQTFHAIPDLLATLPAMVSHFGEPYADSSALPTWLLAEQTRQHVTVAIGGDGGDECFAGYGWYSTAARLTRLARLAPRSVFATAGHTLRTASSSGLPLPSALGRAQRGLQMLAVPSGANRFAALRSQLDADWTRRLYAGELAQWHREHGGAASAMIRAEYDRAAGSALRRMRWADISTYLADELLPKVDVATMAHGLEARAPLLDQEVVQFALSLPDSWLIGGDGSKLILRRLLDRYLPPELFVRPKQGFSLPLGKWLSGAARERLGDLSRSERLQDTGWLDGAVINAMAAEHRSGVRDHSQRLFSLIVLDEWLAQT